MSWVMMVVMMLGTVELSIDWTFRLRLYVDPAPSVADFNCNGMVDARDTKLFLEAFARGRPGWVWCGCDCNWVWGRCDMNGDGAVDLADYCLYQRGFGRGDGRRIGTRVGGCRG